MSSSHRGQGSSWDSSWRQSSRDSGSSGTYVWSRENDRKWKRQTPYNPPSQAPPMVIPEEGDVTTSESEGQGRWKRTFPIPEAMPTGTNTTSSSSSGSRAPAREPDRRTFEGCDTSQGSKGKGKSQGKKSGVSGFTELEPPISEPWRKEEFFPMNAKIEDILLCPPLEFPVVVLVCDDPAVRNQTILSMLTSEQFIAKEPLAQARKFLARIFLGFMTRAEWIKYGFYCRYADAAFRENHADHPLVKFSRRFSYYLRHSAIILTKANERNAVEILDLNKSINILDYSKTMFRMAACFAMNAKNRFFAQISVKRGPDELMIHIGAQQGHTQKSPCFDLSTTGKELRTVSSDVSDFGILYHVTPSTNLTSIKRLGLLADPVEKEGRGRLAVHFAFAPRIKELLRKGTQLTSYEGRVSVFVFNVVKFYEEDPTRQVFFTENGVILYYGNIPSEYINHIPEAPCENKENIISFMRALSDRNEDLEAREKKTTRPYVPRTKEELQKEAGLSGSDPSLGGKPEPGNMTFDEVKQTLEEEVELDIDTTKEKEKTKRQQFGVIEFLGSDEEFLQRNSCSTLIWKLFDQGFLFAREEHTDLGLWQRKIMQSDIYENQVWYMEWSSLSSLKILDEPIQSSFLKSQDISQENWKTVPYSGLAVYFLWSAWRSAKLASAWQASNHPRDVKEEKVMFFRNQDWNGVGFEDFDEEMRGQDRESQARAHQERLIKTEEKKVLNRDWRIFLDMFFSFFVMLIRVGKDTREFHFSVPIIYRILSNWKGEEPSHEWSKNIVKSLKKHFEKETRKANPLYIDVTEELWPIDELLKHSSVTIEEEMDYVPEVTVNQSRSQENSSGRNSPELEPEELFKGSETEGRTSSKSVREEKEANDEEGSETECEATATGSVEEQTHSQLLVSWLQFLTQKGWYNWPKDQTSPLRLLDPNWGCTAKGLNDSHAFEFQEEACLAVPFSEHPHALFQFDAKVIFEQWNYDFTTQSDNTVYELLDCRVVSESSAKLSKASRDHRDRAVMKILEDLYSEGDWVEESRRREYIFKILEAGFRVKEIDCEKRSKGFNSTTNLNVLIGNFGNFSRSAKPLHPRSSASQFMKARPSMDPSDNLLVRLIEGMSSHLVVLCESGAITERELSYLEHQGHFSYAQNQDKTHTVLIRGENCTVKVLFDNLLSPYHQAYWLAKDTQVELGTMPNVLLPFTIFEVTFGTIGSGHQVRTVPSTKANYSGENVAMKAKRTRLFGNEVTTSIPTKGGSSSTEEVPCLSRANMFTYRVCVFHAQNELVTKSPARAAENFFFMWELCLRFQCDLVAGDANMAGYKVGGSKQIIPSHKTACFASTLEYLVGKWNSEKTKTTGNTSQNVEVDFVSSNSVSQLYELVQFYNEEDRGRKIHSKEVEIPYEDWPCQDCIHAAIFSYGHSISDPEDFAELRRRDEDEFAITVSENVSEVMQEALLLSSSDGDFHSPIWLCIDLPERTAKLKHELRPMESRKRAHDTRKERQKAKLQEHRTSATTGSVSSEPQPDVQVPSASSSSSRGKVPTFKFINKGKGKGKDKQKGKD